jgi:hypothetical protein
MEEINHRMNGSIEMAEQKGKASSHESIRLCECDRLRED